MSSAIAKSPVSPQEPIPSLIPVENYREFVEKPKKPCGNAGESVGKISPKDKNYKV